MSEETKTAEEILNEIIRNYNSKVPQTYWFQFDKQEKSMFLDMMEEYKNQELTQQQEINADLQKRLSKAESAIEGSDIKIYDLKKQNAELVALVKQAQNLTARTSKESFERYDRFMLKSVEVLKEIENGKAVIL